MNNATLYKLVKSTEKINCNHQNI